jgi:hypothetical protein
MTSAGMATMASGCGCGHTHHVEAWSRAQSECRNALRVWLDSGSRPGVGSRNHVAYCAYRAALDREEAAAVDLERLSHLVPECAR